MSGQEIRGDFSAADGVVMGFLPDPAERLVALQQLISSADYAHSVAPAAWGVTLYRDLFRLNVGQVEVLVVGREFIRLNCVGTVGMPPFVGALFEEPDYRSVPDPKCAFVGPLAQFLAVRAELQLAHLAFIEVVGRKRSGEPVAGSPFRKSHSPGLIAYARTFLATGADAVADWRAGDEIAATGLFEGTVTTVTVNAYERNPEARAQCIAHYGPVCVVCGFDFGTVYGNVAEGFIHVHHLKPLSEIGEEYEVDPVADLRPVCPNCHAVIHLGGEGRSIEDVQAMMRRAKQGPGEGGKPL
jgi:5-methylcytosine-specific restriction enzyme A